MAAPLFLLDQDGFSFEPWSTWDFCCLLTRTILSHFVSGVQKGGFFPLFQQHPRQIVPVIPHFAPAGSPCTFSVTAAPDIPHFLPVKPGNSWMEQISLLGQNDSCSFSLSHILQVLLSASFVGTSPRGAFWHPHLIYLFPSEFLIHWPVPDLSHRAGNPQNSTFCLGKRLKLNLREKNQWVVPDTDNPHGKRAIENQILWDLLLTIGFGHHHLDF